MKEGCKDSNVITLEYTVYVVATPTISVNDAGKASISCTTGDALIYYTIGEGEIEDPTNESETYSEPVQMTNGQTIKAIAYKDGYKPSDVVTKTFVSGLYDVTFNPTPEHGTVTVNEDATGTVKVVKGSEVTIVAKPATNYHFVSWTITPEVTFISGSATDATATFTMPESAVVISATFEKDAPTAPVVSLDFTKIVDFSKWTTSYTEHVVEYTNATVTFSSANRQTSTITDCPVTKGSDITVVMKGNTVINSLILVTKKWIDKENTVTLHTSTDNGTTYTKTSYTAGAGASLSATDLKNVNAIKFTFSSTKNQIGISSLSLNGAE